MCCFFFCRQAFANLTMLLRGASQSWSFFLNCITLYKPRMPSVLYIFIRASNIPLYCRFDGSTPASYCNTSRVFVTHIGFVMQRVMAPENRWKLDWLLSPRQSWSQFAQFSVTHASMMTKLLILWEYLYYLEEAKFRHNIVLSFCL